mmetsp:Transcript_45823/g.127128  ORF Transcript_45823/g.127128 Transcript_45823/m.127128 type:complete len:211 (-) Transcript_45823:97-729(-)
MPCRHTGETFLEALDAPLSIYGAYRAPRAKRFRTAFRRLLGCFQASSTRAGEVLCRTQGRIARVQLRLALCEPLLKAPGTRLCGAERLSAMPDDCVLVGLQSNSAGAGKVRSLFCRAQRRRTRVELLPVLRRRGGDALLKLGGARLRDTQHLRVLTACSLEFLGVLERCHVEGIFQAERAGLERSRALRGLSCEILLPAQLTKACVSLRS